MYKNESGVNSYRIIPVLKIHHVTIDISCFTPSMDLNMYVRPLLLALCLLLTIACQKDQIPAQTSNPSTSNSSQLLATWTSAQEALPKEFAAPGEEEIDVPRHIQLSVQLDVLAPVKQQTKTQLISALTSQLGARLGDERGVVGISHKLGEEQVGVGIVASDACEACVSLKLEFGSRYTFDLPLYKGERNTETSMTLVAPLSFTQQGDKLLVYLDLKSIGESGNSYIASKLGKLPDKIEDKLNAKLQSYWTDYLVERVPTLKLGELKLPMLGSGVRYMPSEVVVDATQQALHITLGTNLPGVDGQLAAQSFVLDSQDNLSMSIHPDVFMSAARLAMGQGSLATRYDAQGQPHAKGRYGVILVDHSGDEMGVTLKADIFDFAQPSKAVRSVRIRFIAPYGALLVSLLENDTTPENADIEALLKSWSAQYNGWVESVYMETPYVDVGLIQTHWTAQRIAWHGGVNISP